MASKLFLGNIFVTQKVGDGAIGHRTPPPALPSLYNFVVMLFTMKWMNLY